jgi:hypothetical protein
MGGLLAKQARKLNSNKFSKKYLFGDAAQCSKTSEGRLFLTILHKSPGWGDKDIEIVGSLL